MEDFFTRIMEIQGEISFANAQAHLFHCFDKLDIGFICEEKNNSYFGPIYGVPVCKALQQMLEYLNNVDPVP